MDGTLVDSTDGVVGAWELFAEKYPGLDVTVVLSCEYKQDFHTAIDLVLTTSMSCKASHGVRTVENLKKHCGINDPEELEVRSSVTLQVVG